MGPSFCGGFHLFLCVLPPALLGGGLSFDGPPHYPTLLTHPLPYGATTVRPPPLPCPPRLSFPPSNALSSHLPCPPCLSCPPKPPLSSSPPLPSSPQCLPALPSFHFPSLSTSPLLPPLLMPCLLTSHAHLASPALLTTPALHATSSLLTTLPPLPFLPSPPTTTLP